MTTASKWRLFVVAALCFGAIVSVLFGFVTYTFSGDAFQPKVSAFFVPLALAIVCGLGAFVLIARQEREDNE